MNFTLEGRTLKYVDENTILMYRNYGNWTKKPQWCEINIWNHYKGYKMINICNNSYLLHRIIGYLFLGLDIENINQHIDHIDGNKQNNSLENLRVVSNKENHWNMTKAKGYSWCKMMKKFRARITFNDKQILIGYYDTEEEARQAYLDAKKIYHEIP
jgi:hypothetical protein